LLPINGDGVGSVPVTIYPLVDDGGAVTAAGDITPAGTQTELASYVVSVNNIQSQAFTIAAADTVATIVTAMTAAINGELNMPIIATDATPGTSTEVGIAAKWGGASGNDLNVEVVGSTTAGTTFAFTQPTGGATNPDVQDALDQVGNVWETMFLNCMNITDTATLDIFSAFGEGRWGALVRKPMVAFTGITTADVTAATAISDARGTDRVNSQLVSPGSVDLPFVVAARQLARIVVVANNNAPHDYGSQLCQGLTPGTDGEQWTYPQRDQAVKAGSSTVEVRDNIVTISDVVTMYHPVGDPLPAYRYVVDIVKLQNIIFNYDVAFANAEWDGAPLIPDDQPTNNPSAKKPKTAIATAAAITDGLALAAIISDAAFTKANTVAAINESNPKRLDLATTVKLSGNANIISVDINFGFFFGTAPIVA
jgi:phage tail sheath gpL-like